MPPDPLLGFLVPPAATDLPPRRSAPLSSPCPQPPPDPDPPPCELAGDGPNVPGLRAPEEIVGAEGTQRQLRPESANVPGHRAQGSPDGAGGPQPQPRPADLAQQADGDRHQPASPTVIDPVLKQQAQAILPELAKDLNKFKDGETQKQPRGSRANINDPDPGAEILGGIPIAPNQPRRVSNFKSTSPKQTEEVRIQEELMRLRIPAYQKGKGVQEEKRSNGDQLEQTFGTARPPAWERRDSGINGAPDARSTRLQPPTMEDGSFEEGWEPARKKQRERSGTKQRNIESSYQPIDRAKGVQIFRERLEGKCYNCFSPNHLAFTCRAPSRCWKCFLSGHHAVDCGKAHRTKPYITQETQGRNTNTTKFTCSQQTRLESRSYAEVVRGGREMALARYPGDPRARPVRGFCCVSATGPIKRRRDDLVDRAVVCWLDSDDSHDTETYHLGDALRCQLHIRREDIQVVKHYPEQFLVTFSRPEIKQFVLDQGFVADGGRVFHFGTWNERLHADNTFWEFRVKVRVEGIPVHCWAEEVATRALGKSCAAHFVEEKTRRRERTRSFDIWAWCCDPCDIPTEVLLTVLEPDRELPPTSVPLNFAPPVHDDPTGPKKAHQYMLRNHLEVVEDLTFLQGHGRTGGHMNRKARREFIWSYGRPDTEGERLPERRGRSRGRDIHYQPRRDDDDYDEGRYRGTRRHRSLSMWARISRCRGGVEDCISSNRWRGRRSSPPRRSRTVKRQLVWRLKHTGENAATKTGKKVTFADPIATILGPNKQKLTDDSIDLIKEIHVDIQQAMPLEPPVGDLIPDLEKQMELDMGGGMQKLDNIMKDLQDIVHFEQPIEKGKMEAIKKLIEQMEKKGKKGAGPMWAAVEPDLAV